MQERKRLGYLPGLDGLRGLALAAVFLYHAGHLDGGFLGVSTFFTLSGFLITSLLLLEHDSTGRVDLVAFWGRRARRLLPAAYATILGIVLWLAYEPSGYPVANVRGDVSAALLYVSNWRFILQDLDYSAAFVPSLFTHFWSLAIEEQFYVVFPLLFVGARRSTRGRAWGLGGVLAGLIGATLVLTLLLDDGAPGGGVYLSTYTRAGEILLGALLAVLVLDREPAAGVRRFVDGLGLAALAAVLACVAVVGLDAAVLRRGGLLAFGLLSVAVVAAVVVGRGVTARLLSFAPLRWLGLVSYGAYLVHYPVIRILSPLRVGLDPGWALTALHATATLAVAWVSFRFLEQPIRHRRVLGAPAAGWLAPVVGAALFVVALAAIPRGTERIATSPIAGPGTPMSTLAPTASMSTLAPTVPISDPTDPPAGTTRATSQHDRDLTAPSVVGAEPVRTLPLGSCVLFDFEPGAVLPGLGIVADPGTDLPKVMLVGDSVGCTAGRGIQRWGEATATMTVLNQSTLGCGLFREGEFRTSTQQGPIAEVCDWTHRWSAQVAAYDPDVVVVLTGAWDVSDRRLPGGDEWVAPGDPGYDAALTVEVRRAHEVLTAEGAAIVWLSGPRIELGQVDGAPPLLADPASDAARMIRYNEIVAAAVGDDPDVHVVDLWGWLESLDGGATAATRRPDGVHFSEAGADELAQWLGPELVPIARAAADAKAARPTVTAPATGADAVVTTPPPGESRPTTRDPATSGPATVEPSTAFDVVVGGDSVSVGIMPAMEAAFDARMCTVGPTACAGLIFSATRAEWSRIFVEDPPDVVVMFYATWENLALRGAASPVEQRPDEGGWQAAYRRAVLEPWLAEARAVGAEVVWVGMPQVRDDVVTVQHQQLNAVWRELADDHDDVTFVDGAAVLAGADGGYLEVDTTVTPAERLFRLDGLHLCPAANERLVAAIARMIEQRVGRLPRPGWADSGWDTDARTYIADECPVPGTGGS